MGNLTFIVPTENQEKLNREDVLEMLRNKFVDLNFEESEEWDSIQVRKKLSEKDAKRFRDFVMDIYFGQECYILDIDRDIKDLEEIKGESKSDTYWDEQIKELKELKEMGGYDKCIQTTYGAGYYTDIKQDVDFFLRDMFKGYIFDEGIHPEFMGPNYVRTKKTSNLKNFGKWLFNG